MRGCGRRGGRWARRGAALALGLVALGLVGGGGGEELLAAALAALGGWGGWGWEPPEIGEGAGDWGGAGNGAGLARADTPILPGAPQVPLGATQLPPGPPQIQPGAPQLPPGPLQIQPGAPNLLPGPPQIPPGAPILLEAPQLPLGSPQIGPGPLQIQPGAPHLLPGPPQIPPGAPPDLPAAPRVLLSPAPCSEPSPFLLVLVPSAPSHAARRQAIRDTWGGSGGPSARTLFVVGEPGPGSPAGAAALLQAEAERHGDLLQGAFADAYANLTRKTLLLLRWAAARCPRAPFVLKADDDVFVNLPALTSYLAALGRPRRLYLGRLHWRVRPERDPRARHHVPASLYPAAAFPPYCSGTAYVLSRDAVAAVLAAAPRVPLVAPEDVWVGLCARRAGLSPRHSARMAGAARFPLDACCYGEVLLSAHRLGPQELRRAWRLRQRGCSAWQRALGVLRCRALAAADTLWH
ncbi:beta-1,3-galactosyltransferase 4 [Phaenicophaeus curvirostris]|uniref:beta-1,3-galactosyltransferase 4 n=1 Tax=Phaenicophaeus curvirostris TaxID=33595 RepID=UPI0037F0CA7A